MVEREKGLTRREFLFKGGIALSLCLTGCQAETITLYPPKATPIPSEIMPPKETIPYQEPEQPEILSLAEVSQLYPLEIENKSSYWIAGVNRAPLEEAMKEVKIDSNQILSITLEDEIGEATRRPTIEATLRIYNIEEGSRELSPASTRLVYESFEEGLTEKERLSFELTVAFKMLLGLVSYLHPYIEDDKLTEDERFKINQELGKELEKIKIEIVSELSKDRSKLIFIFVPSRTA